MMVDPRHLALIDWAQQLNIDFPNDKIPVLYNEINWKDWSDQVIQCPSFSRVFAPRADQFTNWRDWAFHLYQLLG